MGKRESYNVYRPEKEEGKGKERQWSVIMATFVAALGPLTFGYSMGYSSAATTELEIVAGENITSTELRLNSNEISWFGSLLNIGAMIGGPLQGYLIDLLGRKIALIITSLPFCSGYLLISFGQNALMLNSGRFLSGIGVGMASLNVPVYISETASFSNRGALGSVNQLGVTTGILISYIVGYALKNWRWSALVGAFPPAVLVVLMAFMPETARWLMNKKKEDKARKTLRWLRGPNVDIETEIDDIRQSLVSNQGKFSLKEFAQPSILRPFLISMALHFFQQFSGINAVMFYCATIFQKAGFENQSTLVPIIIGSVQVLSSAISLSMVDRGGRRFLLITAGISMAISCATTGLYFKLIETNPLSADNLSWIAVTSLSIYIVAFGYGWGPCTWLLMSEIFPVRARGAASGIATFFNWFCSFVLTKTFSDLLRILKPAWTFWVFAIIMVFSVLFVYFLVPETKGISLEEIQIYFESKGKKRKGEEKAVERGIEKGIEKETDV